MTTTNVGCAQRRFFAVLSIVVLLMVGAGANAHSILDSVADELTPLFRADEAVIEGELANGMRYFLLQHDRPEDFVELRLVVRAGSVHELERQQGIAHFVEHMGFNGTQRFPGNSLIEELERLGTSFGRDLNAYTGFDATVYSVQISSADQDRVLSGLDVLWEWAFAIQMDDAEIRSERGVVLEELALRERPQTEAVRQHYRALVRGTSYEQRFPSGQQEIIRGAPADEFRSFYRQWYVPDRMAVVVVGDIDADSVADYIESRFCEIGCDNGVEPSDMGAMDALLRASTEQNLSLTLTPTDELIVSSYSHPETLDNRMVLYRTRSIQQTTELESYYTDLQLSVFRVIFEKRMQRIIDMPNSPLVSVRVAPSFQRFHPHIETAAISVDFAPEQEQAALSALLQELVIIQQYGVFDEEFDIAKRQLIQLYEQYTERFATFDSALHAARHVDYVVNNIVPLSVDDEQTIGQRLTDLLTKDQMSQIAQLFVTGTSQVLTVSTTRAPQQQVNASTLQQWFADYTNASYGNIEPPAGSDNLTELPDSTGIVIPQPQYDATHSLYRWTMANGLAVIFRPSDYKAEEISIDLYSRGGASLYTGGNIPSEDDINALLSVYMAQASGLGNLTPTQLDTYLTDYNVSAAPYITEFTEGIAGNSSTSDVEVLGRLLYTWFTNPRFDTTLASNWKQRQITNATNVAQSAQFQLIHRLHSHLFNNQRHTVGTLLADDYQQLNIDRSYEIFQERFADIADFKLVVVGDATPDELMPLLQLLAAIPNVNSNQSQVAVAADASNDNTAFGAPTSGEREQWKLNPISFPITGMREVLQHGSEQSGHTIMVFHGEFEWSLVNNANLYGLTQLIDSRLTEQIREADSSVYSIQSAGYSELLPHPYYIIQIYFGSTPSNRDEIIERIIEVLADISAKPIPQTDIERIIETQLSDFDRSQQSNSYWLRTLKNTDIYPYTIEQALQRPERINGLTADILQQYASTLLNTDTALIMSVEPAQASQPDN